MKSINSNIFPSKHMKRACGVYCPHEEAVAMAGACVQTQI